MSPCMCVCVCVCVCAHTRSYADYDYETFKRTFLMTNLTLPGGPPAARRRLAEAEAAAPAELAARRSLLGTYIDWREQGKVGPVKDQGA